MFLQSKIFVVSVAISLWPFDVHRGALIADAYYTQNVSWSQCEGTPDVTKVAGHKRDGVTHSAWSQVPSWMNSGSNRIAVAFVGSVSYRDKQAHNVDGLAALGDPAEFIALGPVARHYERFLFQPNNFQIDVFLFSWAPTVALQHELIRLYRPFRSRFERQSDWLPRFERAVATAEANCRRDQRGLPKGSPPLHSISYYVSIYLALEMVHNQEVARGTRYDRVVIIRPDTEIHRTLSLVSYDVDNYVFHNSGNSNTADMIFIMSSKSAERFACVPRFLPSASYYHYFTAHDARFIPKLIPEITNTTLDTAYGNAARRGRVASSMNEALENDAWLDFRVMYPYRLLHLPEWCGFPQYDWEQRNRCNDWIPEEHGHDQVCSSLLKTPTQFSNVTRYINLEKFLVSKSNDAPVSQSLRTICEDLPAPSMDRGPRSGQSKADGRGVMEDIFGPLAAPFHSEPSAVEQDAARHDDALALSLRDDRQRVVDTAGTKAKATIEALQSAEAVKALEAEAAARAKAQKDAREAAAAKAIREKHEREAQKSLMSDVAPISKGVLSPSEEVPSQHWLNGIDSPDHEWDFRSCNGLSTKDSQSELLAVRTTAALGCSAEGAIFAKNDGFTVDSWNWGGDLTIEVSIKFNGPPPRNVRFIEFKGASRSYLKTRVDGIGVAFAVWNDRQPLSQVLANGVLKGEESSWMHFVVAASSERGVEIFKNGLLVAAKIGATVPTEALRELVLCSGVNGTLSHLRIWHGKALTKDEASVLYLNRHHRILALGMPTQKHS